MASRPTSPTSIFRRRLRTAASRTNRGRSNRGVALLITLSILALLGAASLALVLMVSSDTMINGYYRNYRGSFYSADSGVNVAVEAMKSAVNTAASDTSNPPLPVNGVAIPTQANTFVYICAPGSCSSSAYPSGLTSSYSSFQSNYYSIGDTGSWKGQFEVIANADGNPILGAPQFELEPNPKDANSCLPVTQTTPCATANPAGTANTQDYIWTYFYPYEVTVQGQSSGGEKEVVTETGTIVYTSTTGSATAGPPLFSKWGAFINNFGACQGPLVPGTMSGPFFTNGQWNFGNFGNPGYTFTGTVGQAQTNASWFSNSRCTNSPTAPNGFRQPNFEKGFTTGDNKLTPPSDSYSQAQAVLDGKGIPPCSAAPCPTDNPPTQAAMNQTLKLIDGTSYPSTGSAPNGVYIPWYNNGSQNVYGSNPSSGGDGAGGGFYINGDASISLSATTGGDGTSNPTQTYTVTQGSTTTTIVVDSANSTTTVTSGSTTLTLQGIPKQLNPTGGQIIQNDPSGKAVNPSLVYVNGKIKGLSGTVQNDMGVTIAAANDVSITGDLTYLQSPVSIPSDTLNTSSDAGVLGVFTPGNINLYPNSSGPNQGNLTVDASLAAISNGTSGFETPGSGINTWTIVGGRSEDQAHGVNIAAGNTYYDQRFANNFGPAWFPTAIPQAGPAPILASQTITVKRASWQEDNRQ